MIRRDTLKQRLIRESGMQGFVMPETPQSDGYLTTLGPVSQQQNSFAAELLFMPHPVYDAPSCKVMGEGQYAVMPTADVPLWCRRFMEAAVSYAAIRGGQKSVSYLPTLDAVSRYLHPAEKTLPASSTGEVSQNETNLHTECPLLGSGENHCGVGALAVDNKRQHS